MTRVLFVGQKLVPLADSTIYEMEKRGEFPRRFNVTPAA